jgi:hypothetical protein
MRKSFAATAGGGPIDLLAMSATSQQVSGHQSARYSRRRHVEPDRLLGRGTERRARRGVQGRRAPTSSLHSVA